MKLLLPPTLFSVLWLCGCSNAPQPAEPTTHTPQPAVEEPSSTVQASSPISLDELSGKVLETMEGGGYAYALVDIGEHQVWVAGMAEGFSVGSQVTATGLMPMKNFESKSLGRTFELIYFCNVLQATGTNAHSKPAASETSVPVNVEQAKGGQTVGQIFQEKDQFVGKQVVLRGKVVKFSAAIMGKNWIHLQDGSGSQGTNDLVITTDQTVAVGDTVIVRGVLVADKDFGYGYKYALMIEDAQVTAD